MPSYKFPKDFLWGTATAAHQIEGNNKLSDWCVLQSLEIVNHSCILQVCPLDRENG